MEAEALSFHRRASRCCFELPQCHGNVGTTRLPRPCCATLSREREAGSRATALPGPLPRTEQPLNQVASAL
jgi:hypothetical protein